MLPHAAWPPIDIIHKPPLEYLTWINQLPNNLKSEVIHQTLPCSILLQKEKVCLSGGPGPGSLAAGNSTKQPQPGHYIYVSQPHCGSYQTTQKRNVTQVTQPRKAKLSTLLPHTSTLGVTVLPVKGITNQVRQHPHPIRILHCLRTLLPPQIMEGPGLAYVAFSQAISLFPGSSFWAIVFFMSLVIMGLGTMITLLEGIVLPLQKSISTFEKHPKLVQGRKKTHTPVTSPILTPSIPAFTGTPPTHKPQCTPIHFDL